MHRAYDSPCAHMRLVAELNHEQIKSNRYFLHDYLRYATSWKLGCMVQLENVPGVGTVRGDRCQYGAVVRTGRYKDRPVKKPTGFMSNSVEILHALSRICKGRHGNCSRPEGGSHVTCSGEISKDMAKYPRELCRSVLRGLTSQLRADKRLIAGCYGILATADPASGSAEDADGVAEKFLYGPAQDYSGKYKGDLTGQPLRDDLVKGARAKESEFFCSKSVWVKVPRQRSFGRTQMFSGTMIGRYHARCMGAILHPVALQAPWAGWKTSSPPSMGSRPVLASDLALTTQSRLER